MRVPNFVLHYLQRKYIPLSYMVPDEIIGHNARSRKIEGHPTPVERPFLLRWFIKPKNPKRNYYFHCFCRDDEDRALHDHPWWNISILLWGQYIEVTGVFDKAGRVIGYRRTMYRAGDLKFRRAGYAHRVELIKEYRDVQPGTPPTPIPCYSLFITGPVRRKWGFHCPAGWRSSHEFHDKKGCIND